MLEGIVIDLGFRERFLRGDVIFLEQGLRSCEGWLHALTKAVKAYHCNRKDDSLPLAKAEDKLGARHHSHYAARLPQLFLITVTNIASIN